MKNKPLLFTIALMVILISSCDHSIDDALLPTGELTLEDVVSKGLSADTLELENPTLLEETEELRVLNKYMERKKNDSIKIMAYGDYDSNFSSNIWAIRELPVSICVRGQANKYLSCEGKGKEVKLLNRSSPRTRDGKQKFYLKILPASSGIPYLIYSQVSKTPLAVGQYNTNPNNKILFAKSDDTGSLFFASWNLIPSQSSKGYFAIESQSYLGQSDPNNWWSVFKYVLEVKNDNSIGYSQYTNKAQQEFLLSPEVTFQLKEVTFDANSAIITPAADIKIVSTARNTSVEPKPYTIPVFNNYNETSYFIEKQSNITFHISGLTKIFQRPTVQANRIVLPEKSTLYDAIYRTSGTQSIRKTLDFNIEGEAPENCLIEVTSSIKTYNVSINYTVNAIYGDREIKFSGTWKGYVISDPKLAKPTHIPRFFDLDTGEEIYYFMRSAIKTTFKQ